MSLREELEGIEGVGPKTIERITTVLNNQEPPDEIRGLLDDAVAYYEQGDVEYAFKFVRQARDQLE